ncbi:free fatty acid receptor 2-like [Sceloporus undulatus]|uniref:free fatty acid receptor 2-like n=1 Tax=Sceloporus undulatus TaxID=8520 RepID=UPI001C4A9EF8|nr:free fatty acid receptor 2-like [Sceloporus undulatus]
MAPKSLVLAVYTFAFVTGLPSNLLACYSFLKKVRQNPAPIDILLLNLTISDLFLLFFLPFKMVEAALDNTWPLPYFLCPLANLFFYGSTYLSTLFLMGVSVERYLCIAHPVKHKLNRRPTYAKVASLFFWLLTFSHCLSIVYVVEYYDRSEKKPDDNSTCYENFTPSQLRIVLPFRLEFCIVLFFIPFIITLFCYISVIRILTIMPNIKPQKKQRAVALALATVLNFSLAFAPYNISHIVGFIQNKNPSWRVETFFLTSLNTTLDPVIFFFSSATIRQVFTEYWLGIGSYVQAFVSWCPFPCCSIPSVSDEEDGGRSISNLDRQTGVVALSSDLTVQHRSRTSEQQ